MKNEINFAATIEEAKELAANTPNGKICVGFIDGKKWYLVYNSHKTAFVGGEMETKGFEYYANQAFLKPGDRCPLCGAMKRGGWHNAASAANGKAKGGRPKKTK